LTYHVYIETFYRLDIVYDTMNCLFYVESSQERVPGLYERVKNVVPAFPKSILDEYTVFFLVRLWLCYWYYTLIIVAMGISY